MLTAQKLDNPAGLPPEAPKLQPSDYAYAAGLISLHEIIRRAGRNAQISISASVKRMNLTFTLQPYIDYNQPRIWVEAYTSDPDTTTDAKLIGMARISFNTSSEDEKTLCQAIRDHQKSLSLLHED